MITRVLITGLSLETIKRLDRVLGIGWRFDFRENGNDIYDVDVANKVDVMYVSSELALNAIVLGVGDFCAGLKRSEFDSIIAG